MKRVIVAIVDILLLSNLAVARPTTDGTKVSVSGPISDVNANGTPHCLPGEQTGSGPSRHMPCERNGIQIQLAFAGVEIDGKGSPKLALASLDRELVGISGYGERDESELPEIAPPRESRLDTETAHTKTPNSNAAPLVGYRMAKPQEKGDNTRPHWLGYQPAIRAFKFDVPTARNSVAIYDISASVVHMPDGTELEAHSGIGKMADDPSFVHVKMNGPTPPNTYRLSMREKRFHGIEALGMTPIGRQPMHGRDGFLAHSYLLRGGRAESHGCVAFKDYPRFLEAFKQGKVTHIIVVPSTSKVPELRVATGKTGDFLVRYIGPKVGFENRQLLSVPDRGAVT